MEEKRRETCDESKKYLSNMSAWRLEECPPYADTYIEWRFEKKCREYRNGVHILTEWRDRKKQLVSYLESAVFDFQHYSRHDESHTLNILESIEMLLGQERIDKLSIGDLWLLLECAYSHDMGMSYTYEELKDLWENDKEFEKYIRELNEHEKGEQAAVRLYKRIDNFLRNNKKIEDLEAYFEANNENESEEISNSWPLEFEKGIQIITSEFARRRHAERLMDAIEKLDEKKDSEIPVRLYKIMVNACTLHGKKFQDIFHELHYCDKGFGNSSIHPQFVAAMLRIGDLLDLDNNRFNVRAMERFGELPILSLLHYKKHKAIEHLAIRTDGIEVEASSDDVEVCKVIDQWFQMLDREVEYLICNWNKIVPEALKGCLLNTCDCKIFLENQYGKKRFFLQEDNGFQINKQKMIELLMGENIYNSHIDFIREYLQNALDASKMRLWQDVKNEKIRYSDDFVWKENTKELTPFDIGASIYQQYAIEVSVDIDAANQKIILEIKDVGIGIEEECIKVISNVGGGWRKRSQYREDLAEMPSWLRPTGGFGIGIQSAFMVANEVEISTRGLYENEGRRLILQNPRGNGQIIKETVKGLNEGTVVKVAFDWEHIFNVQNEIDQSLNSEKDLYKREPYEPGTDFYFSDGSFFNEDEVRRYTVAFIENYISQYFMGTMIPFKVIFTEHGRKGSKMIPNKKFPAISIRSLREAEIIQQEFEINKKKYLALYLPQGEQWGQIVIWDMNDAIFTEIEDANNYLPAEKSINCVCFKNVRVNHEKSVKNALYEKYYNIFMDYEGFYAEKILKVHREEFNSDFNRDQYVHDMLDVYFHFLHYLWQLSKEKNGVRKLTGEMIFGKVPVFIQLIYLNKSLAFIQQGMEEYLQENSSVKNMIAVLEWKWNEKYEVLDEFTPINKELEIVLQSIYKVIEDAKQQEYIIVKVLDDMEIDEKLIQRIMLEIAKKWRNSVTSKWLDIEIQEYEDRILNIYSGELCTKETQQDMKDWLEETIDVQRIVTETDKKVANTLDLLYNCDYIISDTTVVEFLLAYSGLEKYYFSLGTSGTVFAILRKRVPEIGMEKKDFYKKSYDRIQYKLPIFTENEVFAHKKLLIKKLPHKIPEITEPGGRYLVSPINKAIFEKIEKLTVVPSKNVAFERLTYEKFSQIVFFDPSFKALEKWVYHNQIEKGRYSFREIHDEYVRYTEKIYEWWIKERDT